MFGGGDTRELPVGLAGQNSLQSLWDPRSLRCTNPFARLFYVHCRGTVRFLWFSFSKQVVLLKVKYFQHCFLYCRCYCASSTCPSHTSACDG